jgi:hypothetical protein
MNLHALRWRLVDRPDSWGARRRETRTRWLAETFADLAEMSVVDLGGRVGFWSSLAVRPRHVHVVNLEAAPADLPAWAEFDHGDACALPDSITKRRYDLVFSNSVIEHVGGHERRLRFAESVHLLAPAHWIQTPYRYFPIEPHWIAPGMQFLPVAARRDIARKWPLAYTPGRTREEALARVLWTELLDKTQMRSYFPDSTLRAEKVVGITKSLIAYKTA